MQLRARVADIAFDEAQFERLRANLCSGRLGQDANRLRTAPIALTESWLRSASEAAAAEGRAEAGRRVIRAGAVASLVLNGGMATRFGGGAKGAVSVISGRPETFLSLKLGACARLARTLGGTVPVVVMNSFATREESTSHLNQIDWAGVPREDRYTFEQSIMPRLTSAGEALVATPDGASLSDTDVYAAPGHGDTLGRLRNSGVLDRLRDRGVEHVLVSNVDNLGASVDPIVLGAHLEAASEGSDMTVEVVRRRTNDAGGCVALVDERPVIVEGFRLPAGTDLAHYPHFNTNTLWFRLSALDRDFELTWFPVRKRIELSDGRELEVVQFERLIGQATECLNSSFLEVDRDRRFLPVKTRAELAGLRPIMQRLIDGSA